MSLLTLLETYFQKQDVNTEEFEYRLQSWGEIFPPFIGDREHSTAARYILRDFPFKLFSVSIPYSEIPQKLSLTFRAPLQTFERGTLITSSYYPDKIAKEFAAFLSVVTRRRVFAIGMTRIGGLPTELSADIYDRTFSQERQIMKEIEPDFIYHLLKNLAEMNKDTAERFILAIRLYHSAIEMMYTEPQFSYLFLIMSIEAISSAVLKDIRPSDEGDGRTELEHHLDSNYPGWRKLCNISSLENREQVINMLLTKAYFVRRKFRLFVRGNLPEKFWTEQDDDAKPDYLTSIVYPGPDGVGMEKITHSEKDIKEYERIDRDNLDKTLDRIYDARSRLVHDGLRFPSSIVVGHYKLVPAEAMDELWEKKNVDPSKDLIMEIPPLITFERLVSYTLVEFLHKQSTT